VQPLAVAYPYAFAMPVAGDTYIDLEGEATKHLREFAQGYTGVAPELLVQQGFVPEAIVAFANRNDVDLIVMGTHGRQGLDRLALGSVTEKVLRKARCPVLAVRKPAHDFVSGEQTTDPVHLRKILFCTDFSDRAHHALSYAFSLAMEYNAELTLLHVLDDIGTPEFLKEGTITALAELEKPVPPDVRNWCSIKAVVRVGRPYQEIIQLALESQSDLIVMGVRGRGALDLALFGSTTQRVLQLGSCPILAVHEPPKAAEGIPELVKREHSQIGISGLCRTCV
jgi:nucleotide-binding universal stress UspA family protein